jgi:hypothetical protein
MGCGIVQEHFFGCSDIAIKPKNNSTIITTTINTRRTSTLPITTKVTSTFILITNTTKSKPIIRPTGDDTYNGCRSKLYYGKKIDLSKAVLIYCSEVCKPLCNDSSIYSIDEPERASICKSTCPALCSCI